MSEKDFTRLYDTYADALFRFCAFKVSDKEQAKDLLSDTFVRAWEYVRKGGAVENEKAFLYKIASNLIIDYRRKKKTLSLDALTEEGFDVSTDEHLRLEEIIDARQAVQALDKIPEQYRDALFMRFIQELGPKEIAEVLGVSENVVSVRINRGLEKVRALFATNQSVVKDS